MNKKLIISALLFLFFGFHSVVACTAFLAKGKNQFFAAKSYDWRVEKGFLLVNKRNSFKVAFPTQKGCPAATWTSKYGSITFNQYGKELPNGGINEAGLTVEVLWLSETEYPETDYNLKLNELQWVQYQLDNFSRVEEVVEALDTTSIVPVFGNLHYFLADAAGNVAIIEFVKGKTLIYIGKNLPAPAITNNTYLASLNYLQAPKIEYPSQNHSLNRFSRVAQKIESQNFETEKEIFGLLADVWVRGWSRWNIVYNISQKKVFYRTAHAEKIKELSLSDVDFSPQSPVVGIDLAAPKAQGDISGQLLAFGEKENETLMVESVEKTGIPLPENVVRAFAHYPANRHKFRALYENYMQTVGSLKILATGMKNSRGTVRMGLVDSKENYEKRSYVNGAIVEINNDSASAIIYNLPYGEYALMIFHDENGNGRLDRNGLKIPTESYAFSNNPAKILGIPAYKRVKFKISAEKKQIEIHF